MQRLRPDSRGILQMRKPTIKSGSQVTVYKEPNRSLLRIDKLRKGAKPHIYLQRKNGGLGDVLMTTPTVRAIAQKYDIKVDYGTNFNYLEGVLPKVLRHNPYINKVVPWQDIDPKDYDAYIDFTCPCVAHEQPLAEPINRVDLFARHVKIKLEDPSIDYFVTKEEQEWAKRYLYEHNLDRYRLIMVNPSSSSTPRDMPTEKLRKAIANIVSIRKNIRAIVVTHESDNKRFDWNFTEVHCLHNHDVRALAAIMQNTELLICPDSGLLHVACALHHPTFTIFGPTDPRARVNYHPEAVAYWPAKELKNYPSWFNDPRDGYLCWKRVEEATIIRGILAMIDKQPLPVSRDFVTFGNFEIDNKLYEII